MPTKTALMAEMRTNAAHFSDPTFKYYLGEEYAKTNVKAINWLLSEMDKHASMPTFIAAISNEITRIFGTCDADVIWCCGIRNKKTQEYGRILHDWYLALQTYQNEYDWDK